MPPNVAVPDDAAQGGAGLADDQVAGRVGGGDVVGVAREAGDDDPGVGAGGVGGRDVRQVATPLLLVVAVPTEVPSSVN